MHHEFNGRCTVCRLCPKFREHPASTPTLRDQFAMAALTGIIASNLAPTQLAAVEAAFQVADCALIVKEKKL